MICCEERRYCFKLVYFEVFVKGWGKKKPTMRVVGFLVNYIVNLLFEIIPVVTNEIAE